MSYLVVCCVVKRNPFQGSVISHVSNATHMLSKDLLEPHW